MYSISQLLASGLAFLTVVSGSPLPVTPVPHYFQRSPITRRNLTVTQVQLELGPQLSNGSIIFGPSNPIWDNSTIRYSTFSDPVDLELVVEVHEEADVSKVVKYCHDNSINFLTYNRGHGFTTTLTKLKGIEINVSQLDTITIQPDNQTAWFGGGAYGGDIISTLWDLGFVTTTGSNECVGLLGPGLGGGFGRYQGLHGLVSDNFVNLNVVLANGSAIRVNETSYPDLFWAMRGAGHNFGIVTSVEMKIYPKEIDTFHYHNYGWTQDQLELIFETLNTFQGNGTTPALMTVNFGQVSINPDYSLTEALIGWTFAYAGPAEEAEALLAPFNAIPAISSVQGDVSYEELLQIQGTGSTDPTACASHPLIGSTALLQTYNVTAQREIYNLFNQNAVQYPDLAIGARVFYECYSTLGTQAIDPATTAYPHRDEYIVVFFATITPVGDEDLAHQWSDEVRDLFNAGQPDRPVTTYVNYATGDESLESIYGYEPWRLERLRGLKAKYDPQNAFSYYNPIIPPTES